MTRNPTNELDPITPKRAFDLYIKTKKSEVAKSTLKAHQYRLGHFLRWCDEKDIDNLNNVTGRDLHEYKLWRRDEGDLNKVSVKTQMDTLRVFIRWCESIDAVSNDLHVKVLSPSLDEGDNQRNVMVDAEHAEAILDHLDRYRFAGKEHMILRLLWRTGMRIGGLHSLDVEDYRPDEMALHVQHRPETGTTLKNKHAGERYIALTSETCEIIDDWIQVNRLDVADEYGRNPLVSTVQGRAHKTHIRGVVYKWTSPCQIRRECPVGRNPMTCEATEYGEEYRCPESVSPHAVRRGAITHWLSKDVEPRVVSDRMNVSEDVIDDHYDERSERQKMEQRRRFLDNI